MNGKMLPLCWYDFTEQFKNLESHDFFPKPKQWNLNSANISSRFPDYSNNFGCIMHRNFMQYILMLGF